MVSEKVVVVLIIVAILLSVVSIAVTLSAVNTKMIPEVQPNKGSTKDIEGGKVSLIISPWVPPSNSSGK
jgi:hypothetical protein